MHSGSPWRQEQQQSQQQQDSQSRQRIQQLSQKWTVIKQGLDKEKFDKKEHLEIQIQRIEQMINSDRPRDETRFKSLKDHLVKLQDDIYQDRQLREKFDEKKQKDLRVLEDQLQFQLEEEKNVGQNKRKVEIQLLKQIEDRFNNLSDGLSKNNKSYEEKTNEQFQDITYQVQQFRYAVEGETQSREESQSSLVEQIDAQINRFQEMVIVERQVREETQKKIFNMIEDIHSRIQTELKTEKQQREQTTESLLKLLEDTCSKIDDNFKR